MPNSACTHLNSELRWRNSLHNMIGRQCLECFVNVGGSNWVRRDNALRERGTLEGMKEWEEPKQPLPIHKAIPNEGGKPLERYTETAEYRRHLASAYWQHMRSLIIVRQKGMCEGCLEANIEHIHHRSYANFGHEFAFELIGLCEDCHRRWHGR